MGYVEDLQRLRAETSARMDSMPEHREYVPLAKLFADLSAKLEAHTKAAGKGGSGLDEFTRKMNERRADASTARSA